MRRVVYVETMGFDGWIRSTPFAPDDGPVRYIVLGLDDSGIECHGVASASRDRRSAFEAAEKLAARFRITVLDSTGGR